MNQQEGIGAERVSGLCAGYIYHVVIKSFGTINKGTVDNSKKMFDEFGKLVS
jgi:hypothetical protein